MGQVDKMKGGELSGEKESVKIKKQGFVRAGNRFNTIRSYLQLKLTYVENFWIHSLLRNSPFVTRSSPVVMH